MAQDSSHHTSKRLQDRPDTAPSGQEASQGGPQDANILPKPGEKMFLAFSPFRFRWALEASEANRKRKGEDAKNIDFLYVFE